jgi:hypothetical protein
MPQCDNCFRKYELLRFRPLPNGELEALCNDCYEDEPFIKRTWRMITGAWSGVRRARKRHTETSHIERMWRDLNIPKFSGGVWRGQR